MANDVSYSTQLHNKRSKVFLMPQAIEEC